jgi:hypothetical protein
MESKRRVFTEDEVVKIDARLENSFQKSFRSLQDGNHGLKCYIPRTWVIPQDVRFPKSLGNDGGFLGTLLAVPGLVSQTRYKE